MAEVNREHPQGPLDGEDLRGVIFAIFGGDKPRHTPSQRQAYCKEAYKDPSGAHLRNSPVPITFTEDEGKRLHHPHFNALVIDLEIKKHKVMRNLIDNGSSADIIFAWVLTQLDFPEKTLPPAKDNLRGFAGNEVVPLGQIALRVTFGMFPKCVMVNVNFMVVDSPSVYNNIIRRITQHAI